MERFDFIDYDEGKDPREPFFANALPCESCGEPCDELRRAMWDSDLLVGPCCYQQSDSVPDVPVCSELARVIADCSLTSSVVEAMEAHRECCESCRVSIKLEPRKAAREIRRERAA